MTLSEYKKWLLKQLDYVKECEGSPHDLTRKVDFWIVKEDKHVLLELYDDDVFVFDGIGINTTAGCGCWLDFDVHFKECE